MTGIQVIVYTYPASSDIGMVSGLF